MKDKRSLSKKWAVILSWCLACLLSVARNAGSLTLCPLHFSDKKSEQAKDMHLMKRLTSVLKNRDLDPGKDCSGCRMEEEIFKHIKTNTLFYLLFVYLILFRDFGEWSKKCSDGNQASCNQEAGIRSINKIIMLFSPLKTVYSNTRTTFWKSTIAF